MFADYKKSRTFALENVETRKKTQTTHNENDGKLLVVAQLKVPKIVRRPPYAPERFARRNKKGLSLPRRAFLLRTPNEKNNTHTHKKDGKDLQCG